MMFARSQRSFYLTACACSVLLLLGYHYHYNVVQDPTAPPETVKSKRPFRPGMAKPLNEPYTRTLVMGRLKSEDVSRTGELRGLNLSIYTVDDENATLQVPKNKGHEAMVYLSYI